MDFYQTVLENVFIC